MEPNAGMRTRLATRATAPSSAELALSRAGARARARAHGHGSGCRYTGKAHAGAAAAAVRRGDQGWKGKACWGLPQACRALLLVGKFMGERTAQIGISDFFPNVKTGTKTREFVATSHATNSLVFVPGFAVGKLGSPNLGG